MADDSTPEEFEPPRIVAAEEIDGAPVMRLRPSAGDAELPHWTAPPTGQVPRVVAGGDSAASGSGRSGGVEGPQWRDEHGSGQHDDLLAGLAELSGLGEDEPVAERLGALDAAPRPSESEYLNFDDIELDPVRRSRRSRRRADAPPPPTEGMAPVDPADPRASRFTDRDPTRGRTPAPAVPPSTNGSGDRNLLLATAVGLALVMVTLLAFSAGPVAALLLVEVVIVVAGFEYFAAVQRGGFRPATLLGLAAVAAFPLATGWRGEAAFPLVLFLSVVVGVLWYLMGVGGRARPLANLGVTLIGIAWIGGFGAFAALILDIPSEGVSILLLAIVATVGNDVGAYFTGRRFGRSPLSATSPNKTVEGLLGGALATVVLVLVFATILGVGPFGFGGALLFALVAAVVAPLGDLAESLFKRDLGVKDMGALLPHHGGLLDRFDGMLFVLPAAYYMARLLGAA